MRRFASLLFIFILVILLILVFLVYGYYQSSDLKNQVQDIKSQLTNQLPEDSWSFIVIGDNEGVTEPTQNFIQQANQSQAQLIVHLGDFVALGEAEEFIETNNLFDQLNIPLHPTLGNNDLGSVLNYDETNYKKYIKEELYYSFDHQQAHFIILDNANRNIGFDDEQLTWLEEDLKNNQPASPDASQGGQKYTFVFFHKPFKMPLEEYTGDDDTPRSRKQNKKFRALIEQYPVDHIFMGHVHTYFTYTIDNTPATITGGGGAPPQSILGGESSAFYHYLEVTVNDEEFDIEVNKL